MKHPWAGKHAQHEHDSYSWIERARNGCKKASLAVCTYQTQYYSYKIKLKCLLGRKQGCKFPDDSMKQNIEPAADGIVRRIFPSLPAIAMR